MKPVMLAALLVAASVAAADEVIIIQGGAQGGPQGAAPFVVPGVPEQAPAAAAPQYGHAEDYSWVSGQLVHQDLEGGFWQINYIDPKSRDAAKDPHRGKFVLGNPPQLKGFGDGDFVKITGRISDSQASIWMAGTIYDVKTVQKLGAAPAAQPVAAAKLTAEQEAKLKELLKDLGSNQFEKRESAEDQIKQMGPAALPQVRPLVKSTDAEVAERAGRIVEYLEKMIPAQPSQVTVKLSADKAKYKAGERIVLTIEVTNREDKPVTLPGGGSSFPWLAAGGYVLLDADGKQIQPFATGAMVMRTMIYRMPITVAAGASQKLTATMGLAAEAPTARGGPMLRPRVAPVPQNVPQAVPGAANPAPGAANPAPAGGAAAAPDKKPPEGVAYLLPVDMDQGFALPKFGKYTLKLVLAGKAPGFIPGKEEEQPPQPAPGGVQVWLNAGAAGGAQIQVQVQGAPAAQPGVILKGPLPPQQINDEAAGNPLVGTIESNAVTFEVTK